MISQAQFKLSSLIAKRRIGVVVLFGALALMASGCAVQKSNEYPIETFSEMHYSQAFRAQEPPRLLPPASSVVYNEVGGPDNVLNVPAKDQRAYDPKVAAELFRVNCSACHGVDGMGDGRAAAHLVSDQSFYATQNGTTYHAPPNLQDVRDSLTEDALFSTITNGIVVMPKFGKLLSEQEIWDIVAYIKDKQTGLGITHGQ